MRRVATVGLFWAAWSLIVAAGVAFGEAGERDFCAYWDQCAGGAGTRRE